MNDTAKPGTLTTRYKLLKMQSSSVGDDDPSAGELERQIDAIFAQIVAAPVVDLASAVEKLRFAHHCLTEEEDYKEAANLMSEVCQALERRFRDHRSARAVAAKVKSFRFCRLHKCQEHGIVTATVVHRLPASCEGGRP